jgi:chromosome segregation ATPase
MNRTGRLSLEARGYRKHKPKETTMSEDRFKEEVMRYLSAIAVDVGDIRQRVTRLEERADNMEAKFDEKLAALEKKVDEGFEAMRSDIRRLRFSISEMAGGLMEIRADIHDHEKRITALEDKPA